MTIIAQLSVIGLFMVWAAFFAGIETGVISIRRLRLQHFVREKVPGARTLQHFLDNPDRLLGTTLLGTNISVVVTSVTAASLAVSLVGKWGETLSTIVMTLLVVVFCEYLPKAWFHGVPLERSRRFAKLLHFWELVFRPLSVVVVWLTRLLVPGPSESFSTPAPFMTREELKLLAKEGEKEGVLSRKERVMIDRVIELSGKAAREVMVPRAQMTVVEKGTGIGEFFETARESGFTRMPVYDSGKDEFVGVANVFYVLSHPSIDPGMTVDSFTRPPLVIPEDMPADEIFPLLRRYRQPMGLVADAQSNVVGLITTEDVLQVIVGRL